MTWLLAEIGMVLTKLEDLIQKGASKLLEDANPHES
jgi:hypothetical protein